MTSALLRHRRPDHSQELRVRLPRAIELATAAAAGALEKKAENVLAIDVSEQMVITDVFVVASAPNDRQVRAIVDEVEHRLRELGVKPLRREGEREARWVLLDYAEIVVHVQHTEDRRFYALERLWRDCPSIDLSAVHQADHDSAPLGAG